MNTNKHIITVMDLPVEVVRKDIKNLHLAVYPPDGAVRISIPEHVSDDNARLAIISRLPWIRKRQEEFKQQPREAERTYVNGESHYFKGTRYILEVIEQRGQHGIELLNNAKMRMRVNPGTTKENRQLVLDKWYRTKMKADTKALLDKWLPEVDKPLADWGIKRMKTKWGSCNTMDARIWLNLELIKKPPECHEYILVHELTHLYERNHNDNFVRLMDKFLPYWRKSRDVLKSKPLAYEDWQY